MKVNWPFLAVITSFLYFVTGAWADMPNPMNIANVLALITFFGFLIYYRASSKNAEK